MKYKIGDTVRTLVNANGTEKDESPVGSIGKVVDVQSSHGHQELLVNSESFPCYADNEWYFSEDEVELVEVNMGALIGETTYVGDFKIYVEGGFVEITNTYSGIEFASGKLLDVKSELRDLVRVLEDLEQ